MQPSMNQFKCSFCKRNLEKMGERSKHEQVLFVPYENVTVYEKYKPYFLVEMYMLGGYVNCQHYENENYKVAGFSMEEFSELYLERRGFLNLSLEDYELQKTKLVQNMICKIRKTFKVDERKKKCVYFFKEHLDVLDKKRLVMRVMRVMLVVRVRLVARVMLEARVTL